MGKSLTQKQRLALAKALRAYPDSESKILDGIARQIKEVEGKIRASDLSKDELISLASYALAVLNTTREYLTKSRERIAQEQWIGDVAIHLFKHIEPLAHRAKALSATQSAKAKKLRFRDELSRLIFEAVEKMTDNGKKITDYNVACALGTMPGAEKVLRAYAKEDNYGNLLDVKKPSSYIVGTREKFKVLWRTAKGDLQETKRHGINERINTAKVKLRT